MDRRTNGYITLKIGFFPAAIAELTEHTKASSNLLMPPLAAKTAHPSTLLQIYACLNFNTVSSLISILLKVQLMAKCLSDVCRGEIIAVFSILLIFLGFPFLYPQVFFQ